MSTRIGLVSDVHSTPSALRHAFAIFEREKVDDIICAGDIAGYFDTLRPTVDLLIASGCQAIVGNHDQDYLKKDEAAEDPVIGDYLRGLPETLELQFERQRVFVVHANPPSEQHGGIRLLDPEGRVREDRRQEWNQRLADFDYDLLIVGHTHQVYAEQLGACFVVNPGSSAFNHSCMVIDLPELEVSTFALEGHEIVRCWNFGMLRR